jgi:beta-lactamase regulating signal transducer with metallopeptidase domain
MTTRMIAQYLVVVGVKSSLLLAGAALSTLGMRRRAAAARHLVWIGAIIGAAFLPVVGALAPAWNVRLLSIPAATTSLTPTAQYEHQVAAAAPLAARQHRAPNGDPSALAASGKITVATPTLALDADRAATAKRTWPSGAGVVALVALWALGAIWFLVRIVSSVLSLGRLRHRATPVTAVAWERALLTATRGGRRIALLVSDDVDVPLTWGIFRPVILLPREAEEWSEARRDLVLRHEAAHVERYDVLTQLLARVVRAMHWPNPLAWLADRDLRRECEQACDDSVLAAGVRPTRYAEELLAIASALTARSIASLAPGFASRPSLELRLRALLDARSTRRRATRLDAALTAAGVLSLALPLAAMTPAEHTSSVERGGYATAAAMSLAPVRVASVAPRLQSPVAKPSTAFASPEVAGGSLGSAAPSQLCAGDGGSHVNATNEQGGTRIWEVHWSGRDCAVDLRAKGDIRFSDDLTDIASISRDGFFDLSIRQGDELTRIVVKPAGQGELDRRYTVDGVERPWNARAQEWFAEVLLELDRQTGFAVDLRFPKLLARGVPAVLDEIQQLNGDYVRGLYFQRLIERAQLSPSEVRQTLELAGRNVRSDYELARILVAVSERYGLPDEDTRAVFLNAVNKLSSDYERNRALHALLSRADLSTREASAVLQSASALTSDYELARTLVAMTDKKLITPPLRSLYLDDVAKLSSDYERSRVILALLGTGKLSDTDVERVIGLANGIKSDYERARVLVAVGGAYDLSDGARDAYLKTARSITSEYERGRALSALRGR